MFKKQLVFLISIVLFFVLKIDFLHAQTNNDNPSERNKYGVFVNYSMNNHVTSFKELPNVPNCCSLFESGKGNTFIFGGLFEINIEDKLNLQTRIVYNDISGEITDTETTNLIIDGKSTQGEFTYFLNTKIQGIGIQPMLGYEIIDNLQVHLGFYVGMVSTASYTQKEQLTSPSNKGTFLDSLGNDTKSRTRNEKAGDIEGKSSMVLSSMFGLSYQLPLNKDNSLLLAPEFMYWLGLNNVHQDLAWKVNSMRMGIALKYSPAPKPEPIYKKEEIDKIDTIRIESTTISAMSLKLGKESKSESIRENDNEIITTINKQRTDTLFVPKIGKLNVALKAKSYENGKEEETILIRVEEFASTLMTPLLNYVFFDENSAELPSRYKKLNENQKSAFNEKDVNNEDRLSTYYHVLNIIGSRMQANSKSTLKIIGCNSDINAEKSNLDLSKKRAASVKDYLIKTWAIDEKRLIVEARNLPEKAANTQTNDGAQENRRVELIASDFAITAPVITSDTVRTVTPPNIRFYTDISHENNIDTWKLDASQSNKVLKSYNGTGEIPKVIDWDVAADKTSIPANNGNLVYKVEVKDSQNQNAKAESSIPVDLISIQKKRVELINDKEINRFSLVLFDVRSSEIGKNNAALVDMMKGSIKPNSTIKVTGYTDRLGDQVENQKLAEGRANSTAKALGVTSNAEIKGLGNSTTYNPALPEGRLYTRTVDIIIETPVKK